MQLNLEQAFPTEQALRDMIVMRKVCFDHDPFYVKTGAGNVVQIGFQLNLYAAFRDPTQLPLNDCLLYTSPSPRDRTRSRMPSSA